MANNLGDTVTHALAFVYGWGISDTLKLGNPSFWSPGNFLGTPTKRPWDHIYWGDKSIFKNGDKHTKKYIYSFRLSIYTGGFLDAKISKDTQGEWFVSKQPWKKFDGRTNVTSRKRLGMNGARVNRIWVVVFGFEFLQWWNPFCHHSGRSPPGNKSTYLTEEMENHRLNRGFCRRYVSSLECTISSYQLIMISAQFSFDFDLDSWSYEAMRFESTWGQIGPNVICQISWVTLHEWIIKLPSWKLTYPFPNHFWRWFSFSKSGIC